MAILHLDALPPKTTKGTLVRLVTQPGQLERSKIGTIVWPRTVRTKITSRGSVDYSKLKRTPRRRKRSVTGRS